LGVRLRIARRFPKRIERVLDEFWQAPQIPWSPTPKPSNPRMSTRNACAAVTLGCAAALVRQIPEQNRIREHCPHSAASTAT
jgi:hypothetical protein